MNNKEALTEICMVNLLFIQLNVRFEDESN